MKRVDVYFRSRPGQTVPDFKQFSMVDGRRVSSENGVFAFTTTVGRIFLPVDTVRRIDVVDC